MDPEVSQMTAGCEICHNHTIHIKYSLNTQSNVILQINPHTVEKLVPIYNIWRQENLYKQYELFVNIANSSTE
jgi:hypothetical protein